MMKVPDPGHRYADKKLALLAKKLRRSYRQASLNLQAKISAYMEQFEKEDAKQRALYDSGELSHEDYMAWRFRKIAGTQQWRDMLDQLTADLVNADRIAAKMIRDELPEVYAESHNYGTYEIEHDLQMSTSYTLYNRDAVRRLLMDDPDLLPQPRVDIPKDERWNRQHLQSAVTQGILTGESMKKIADRFRSVVAMDERAAMRNARTAVTGAENAGKLDSMKRAQGLGVKLKKLWLATRDQRTRDSHVMLDGELRETDEPFSNELMYPGDPDGAPGEVYNCRCAMRSKVAGADPYSPDLSRNERLGGMSYDEWKEAHKKRSDGNIIQAIKDIISPPEATNYSNDDIRKMSQETIHLDELQKVFGKSEKIPSSFTDVLKNINPQYDWRSPNDDPYKHNCQRCAPIFELQMRGYKDVVATIKNGKGDFLAQFPKASFKVGGNYVKDGLQDKNAVIELMKKWGDGARAMVEVEWDATHGHIFVAVQQYGKTYFIDPQSGVNGVDYYFADAVQGKISILRMDKAKFSRAILAAGEKKK